MSGWNFRQLDADLLLTFGTLLRELNVSRAAEKLGIHQSTMSARLNRLRTIFDDRLFLPSPGGRGVIATPRALSAHPALERVIALLEDLVEAESHFEAQSTQRTFTIALHEIPAVTLAPDLVPRIATQAPQARLAFVFPEPESIGERLETGAIDICIDDRIVARDPWISRTLFRDGFLTARRKDHPDSGKPVDLDCFCAAEHVLVSGDGGGFAGQVDEVLAMQGRERRVALSVQSYAMVPTILSSSDYLCTLPRRFLMRFADRLELFEPPLALNEAELAAYWHPRFQEDPAHRWLREQLFAAVGDGTTY